MPTSVLLLKAADEKYKTALERQDHDYSQQQDVKVYFTEVLTFKYINAVKLQDVFVHLERYSGIIVTSIRSAIAMTNVINQMDVELKKQVLEKLRSIFVFSVGAATSKELMPLGIVCHGDDAGSADMLSTYLHEDGVLPATCKEKPMMFLCGDKRRDALPDSFRSRNLPLEELVVYQTCAVQNVEIPVQCKVPNWIVFFSPSGLKAVKDLPLRWESIHKAAIGKTTAAALHEHAASTGQSFWEADVIAPKPQPESLAVAIFAFIDKHNSCNTISKAQSNQQLPQQ